jgi:thioesterase domain-containing protein/acyl carrier protein
MTHPPNLEDLFPLTPMQHLMLLHSLTTGHQGALLNQVCYSIRGPLREDTFRGVWELLVRRHPALRTGFLWEGLEQPLQAVRGHVLLPFRTVDLASESDGEQPRRLDDLRREDAAAPMPLGKAPLMRCTLARLASDHHYFIWTIHHLVVDRWSHGILFSDLGALHGALVRGEEAQLPPVRGFRDYVAWLSRRDPGEAERFWGDELRGFTEPTLLAGTSPRLATVDRRTVRRFLTPGTSAKLRANAVQWRTTLGAIILSAVGIAFARRLGRDDVSYGLTVSGRPPDLEGAESIVGSFVNNIPARLRIEGARRVSEWVRSVQRDQARRQAFEHASLRDIREWSDVPFPRPLFDTLVLLNLSALPDVMWDALELRLDSATLDGGYPLILAAGADGPPIELTLVHDATFVGADSVLTAVSDALESIASAPADATVAALIPELANRSTPTVVQAPVTRPNGQRIPPATGAVTADALLQLWRDVLGVEEVGLDDDFFGLGGTSLQALELFVRLERLLGRAVPMSTLFDAGSVRALIAELGQPVRHAGSLVTMRTSGTRPPIVAVPGIGGNVLSLAGLSRALGPGQPFFGLQSPGFDGMEAPLTSIEDIAARFVEQVLPAVVQPFHLLGFCWGAAVAFEMARRLQPLGRGPISLTLLDPALLLRQTTSSAASPEATFLRRRLELYWDEFRDADWRQRGKLLARKARRVAGVIARDEAREESKADFHRFKVERANRDAISRYFPQAYSGHTTVFLSSGRDFDTGEDPRLEWLRLITPPPEIIYVPGADSGDVISPAHVDEFAARLRDRLDSSAALAVSG